MRRILVLVGLATALIGALVLWPLGRLLLTHQHGHATVLAVHREAAGPGEERVRVLYQFQTAPGRNLIADRQSDQFFRLSGDPLLNHEDAEAAEARILPDAEGRQASLPVFWRVNRPEESAFIIDVSASHWLRRYFAGAAAVLGGAILTMAAWVQRGRAR